MMEKIKVKRLRERAVIPTYGSAEAAGADLYACLEGKITIAPGETAFVPTGIAMEIPTGCAGLVFARSSLGTKRGLAPANKVGVIDSDYRGEFFVALHNHGKLPQEIEHGERIAQLLIVPVYTPGFTEVTDLSDTKRGSGGFGSTGK
jgi:dUTP pyrophosphatase